MLNLGNYQDFDFFAYYKTPFFLFLLLYYFTNLARTLGTLTSVTSVTAAVSRVVALTRTHPTRPWLVRSKPSFTGGLL